MTRGLTAELALAAEALLAESPRWDAATGRLLWADVPAGTVHSFDPVSGVDERIPVGTEVGTVVPHAGGGQMLGVRTGFAWLRPDGALDTVAEIDQPGLRMNDGVCAPDGAFWAGSMAFDGTPGAGTLYRLGPDGVAAPRLAGVTVSNGIGFTADGARFYYADTPTLRVDVCEVDADDQTVLSRRPFVTLAEGRPDGLALDDDGCVWVAAIRSGRVLRFTPSGVLDTVVRLPEPWPTSCAFGGSDGATLFITTARTLKGERRDTPGGGGIFAVRPGVTGPAALPYRPAPP
ncbi:SMP-30/gluconolactonase/LRE family protein [Streptomyces sp. NPDC001288]|uniref:SMP-30/gluconolactonase/LRE family protein n=1 Tax=Streptomyces sp. NPDC001297 TaxID=3364559 RepID=UPI0036B59838